MFHLNELDGVNEVDGLMSTGLTGVGFNSQNVQVRNKNMGDVVDKLYLLISSQYLRNCVCTFCQQRPLLLRYLCVRLEMNCIAFVTASLYADWEKCKVKGT